MAIGYYRIEGWLKEKDSKGFNAKPSANIHHGTSRNRMRVMFKKYCYKCEDPNLIKVMYYYANNKPENVSRDLSAPEFRKFYKP